LSGQGYPAAVQPTNWLLSGGVLYGRVLHELIPNYWEEAPVERFITNQVVVFMTGDASFSIDFKTKAFAEPPYNAFTVLRSKFDRWLAEKTENTGVMLITGIRVDRLLIDDGRVRGVTAGDDEILADVVIAADGANSFLAQQAGLRGRIEHNHIAVGVKELIELPRDVIDERFNLKGNEGAAYAIVGKATQGVDGGAFLYTNKSSISLGVVMRLDALVKVGLEPAEVMDDFKAHPMIAPLIKNGVLKEYGAHLVPEGGLHMMPKLCTNGMVVVGDAAGFTINNGLVVRGMDLAIGSGIAAADAILDAHNVGDFSAETLRAYERYLDSSFVMRDLRTYATAPGFLETNRLYNEYPALVIKLMQDLYTHDLMPKSHILPLALEAIKKTHLKPMDLVRDGLKGLRAL
jgi:electron transfer flavoprotein-quinone oxidoreductase